MFKYRKNKNIHVECKLVNCMLEQEISPDNLI